ncbi:MAG: hypothetical protein K6U80_02460 [Firmicutes bacterium]|nr:hypothetical protein [Bacillota bacterium]
MMIIEGFMKKQSNGRYAIFGAESDCKLTYYLLSDGLSFYPKKVYAWYDTSFRRF